MRPHILLGQFMSWQLTANNTRTLCLYIIPAYNFGEHLNTTTVKWSNSVWFVLIFTLLRSSHSPPIHEYVRMYVVPEPVCVHQRKLWTEMQTRRIKQKKKKNEEEEEEKETNKINCVILLDDTWMHSNIFTQIGSIRKQCSSNEFEWPVCFCFSSHFAFSFTISFAFMVSWGA